VSELAGSTYFPGIRARTLRGFLIVAIQRGIGLLVTAAGGILLARLLTPQVFGLYAIISFAVGFGVSVGDLGLGAALIQRQKDAPEVLLPTAFSTHLIMSAGLAVLLMAGAPMLFRWLGVAAEALWPFRSLVILLPLSALRMPATVLLERRMLFAPLALAETLDTVLFFSVASFAAWLDGGVWSFILGALAARCGGVMVLWRAAGWRPRLGRDWRELPPILRFGVLFQGNALVTIFRDSVVPTFVAAWSGVAAVGFLNWATAVALLPLQVVSIAGRVLFPALSRLQSSPTEFAAATERALNRVALILYPASLLLLAGAEAIIRPIYGDRWLPAVPAVRLFCLTAILGGTSTLLAHALYSLGRAATVFRLTLFWTALTWALTVVFVPQFGFVGFALASACVAATGVLTLRALRRSVPLRILAPLRLPVTAAIPAATLFFALGRWWIRGLLSLVLGGLIAAAAYVGLVWSLGGAAWRAEVREDCRRLWGSLDGQPPA